MKKNTLLIFVLALAPFMMGFITFDQTTGALIGGIAGLIGASLSYLLVKDEKNRRYLSLIIFAVIFFSIKSYLIPFLNSETYDSDLKEKSSLYNTIAKLYPDEYQNYINEAKKSTYDQKIVLSSIFVNSILFKNIATASDSAIYSYLKANYEMDKYLFNINPAYVLYIETPARFASTYSTSEIFKLMPNNIMQQMLSAKENIIITGSGLTNKKQLTQQDLLRAEKNFAYIIRELSHKYGKTYVDEALVDTGQIKNEKESAQVIITFYELLLSFNEKDAALTYKYLYTYDNDK